MKLNRSQNAADNLKWGILFRFSGILIPFVCRAAIIRIFGINYLGLNNLFASILTALNLAELGFGSAVVYFMYQAIASEDCAKICALLKYYRKVYQIVGLVILVAGLVVMPFLHFFIKKDIPQDVNIYVLYILTLSSTVASYFFGGYKASVLTAFQKESILYKIKSCVLITESIIEIITIFVIRNYYAYLSVSIIATVTNNILTSVFVKKYFPEYRPNGLISINEKNDISEKIRGLFLYKIGSVIVASADSFVISAFIGLNATGIYGNYFYVINLLYGLLAVYYTSFRAGLGNSSITETVSDNYSFFRQLQFMQSWIIGWCTVCLICLYQCFIEIYAGKENLLSFGFVLCISMQFYSWKIQDIVHVYKEACGYWTKDRYRPLVGAIVNLVLNIIMVQFIGLYGVVLSTVAVSVTIDVIWAPKALFKEYFNRSRKEYYIILLKGFVDFIVMAVPSVIISGFIDTGYVIINFLLKGIVCIVIPNAVFICIHRNKKELIILIERLKKLRLTF